MGSARSASWTRPWLPRGRACRASPAPPRSSAAHVEVAAFTASLAARVGSHSSHVGVADARYLANEVDAVDQMAALAPRVNGV